jgi:serine/threonine protein kinase
MMIGVKQAFDVANGLDYLHSQGIIHSDLKGVLSILHPDLYSSLLMLR